MSPAVSSQQVTARPIQVLVIYPDDTYELRTIEQDIDTFQALVGGWVEVITTDYAVFWCDEDGDDKKCPINTLATYLWWNLKPEMAGADSLCGPVFVTGGPHGEHSHPLDDSVIEYFEKMRELYLREKSK
jgi:hypothetical protein